ncbi:MAG: transglutaminase domain-containing protein, partial [Rhodocyclaceae bacterium]|nr:transglutaminase domain-containing protein [Rhodocyclaceae bacterium]
TIYNWVRNNIEYLPTYGSIQGSDLTLLSKRGNAFDTSSLLIALYRAANLPARYVYGTVEISAEQAMNWVGGVTNADAAQSLLSQGGIPTTSIVSGGKIVKFRIETVWVEAWLNYYPSRGAKHKPYTNLADAQARGTQWVPMDASFKHYTYTDGLNIKANVPFNAQTLLDQAKVGATVNEAEGWVQNLNQANIQSQLTAYQNQANAYIDSQVGVAKPKDLFGSKTIVAQALSLLPGVLPVTVKATSARYATLPSILRRSVSVAVYASATDRSLGTADATVTLSLPALANKKLTLSYDPASQADTDYLISLLNTEAAVVPAYLVKLKPVLRLNGIPLASGQPVTMGTIQTISSTYDGPDGGTLLAENNISAGTYTAIVSMLSAITADTLASTKARAEDAMSRLSRNDLVGLTKDDFVGEMLHLGGQGYWAASELTARMAARANNVVRVPLAALGYFSWNAKTTYSFGIPSRVTAGGLATDVDIYVQAAVEKSGLNAARQTFAKQNASSASRNEGSHWGVLLAKGGVADVAISAMHALEVAATGGQKIYVVDSTNATGLLARLPALDPNVASDIRNAINAGMRVTVHDAPVTIRSWQGYGYILEDVVSGAAAYRISGGQNGGEFDCGCLNLPPVFELLVGVLLTLVAEVASRVPALARFALFSVVGQVVLSAVSTYSSWCQIDEATCLTDENRSDLKSLIVLTVLISIPFLFAAGPLAIAALLMTVTLITTQSLVTGPLLKVMQRMNKKEGQC